MSRSITLVGLFLLVRVTCFAQTMNWVPATTSSPNALVRELGTFNGSLIAAGEFTQIGGVSANCIAAWNGTSWSALGKGVRDNLGAFIHEVITFNNDLYVVGQFDSAGTVASHNVAKWNGNTWVSMTSTFGNNQIYSTAIYNNELYVGGSFTNIGGTNINRVAKWNGTSWQSLNQGLYCCNVNDLCVYQNELYALGAFDSIIGVTKCNHIARWNGTAWNTVGNGVPDNNAGLTVYQGKLIIGSNGTIPPSGTQMWQWNGATMSLFSQQTMIAPREFVEFNNQLYSGSFSGISGTPRIWNLSTSRWDSVGTGLNSIWGLHVYNNELYCSGQFSVAGGASADFIAKWGLPAGINENLIDNSVVIYPNPNNGLLKVMIQDQELRNARLTITNSFGQTVLESESKQEIDISFLSSGIYFLRVSNGSSQRAFKIIKQ